VTSPLWSCRRTDGETPGTVDTVDRAPRAVKKKVMEWLESADGDPSGSAFSQLSPIQVINALFPLLYHGNEKIKLRAVTLLGSMAARLADQDMDEARNVVRRLMWNLNDESGGIGWGSPEAMGEILAHHEGLAGEYTHILVSYTRQDANYLEHEVLQRGLLWAIGRVFGVRPERVREASPHLLHYLESGDAGVRGLTAELLGEFREPGARQALERLLADDAEYDEPMERADARRRVMDAAAEALGKMG
jgi:hypothetical protein